MAALQSLVNDGLFIGQKNPEFLKVLTSLAEEADSATRRL
jgi:hypothetical protein